jgi:hypothetical protein
VDKTYWVKPIDQFKEVEGTPIGPLDGPVKLSGEDLCDVHDNVIAQLHDNNHWFFTKRYKVDQVDFWPDVLIYVEE